MKLAACLGAALISVTAAGCSVATSTFNSGEAAGGAIVGSLGAPVSSPAPAAVPPAMGAFLDGPVGMKLGDADREIAYLAEVDAISAGDRKTWRGSKGAYGFVVPNPGETADGCRSFTHTIYLGGRPQAGKGTGCRSPDGAWRITG